MGVLAWAFFPAGLVFMFLPSRLGRLSDRFSRPTLMATGVAVSGTLYISLPMLPSLVWLVVLYTLSAIGWALARPQMTAMVGDLSHEDRRGRIFGIYQMFEGLGLSMGPLLGGWLYDTYGGAIPFTINGAILLSTALFIALALSRGRRKYTSEGS
jgi:MFS family permease